MFAALATCAAERFSAEADEARTKAENLGPGGRATVASHLIRAATYDAAAANIKDKLASAEPGTLHSVFAALATCAAERFSAEAERFSAEADEARAKLNNRVGGVIGARTTRVGTSGRKPYTRWTRAQEEELRRLVGVYGVGSWAKMLEAGRDMFGADRTSMNLKDKWRVLTKAR